MTTVASAESLPISVLPNLTVNRERVIFGRRTIPLRGDERVRGPMLFNTLPSELRNMTNCSSESFKQALDTFLKTIPDEPQTHGYTYMRRADSNSLIHMTPLTTARHPSISELRKRLTTCHKLEAVVVVFTVMPQKFLALA